jgi:hypothetical protein
MTTIDTLIASTFATADAESRLAAADAAFAAHFVALTGDAQARSWRGLDHGAKFRLVCRRIEDMGMSWMPSVVEAQIAKYDARFALGPVEAAVEGALERLAIDNGQQAATAIGKDDRAYFRRASTAYTNALREYRAGVRPDRLSSGAFLLPSSTAGDPPHIVRLDGDWICSCKAQQSMHWPIAMVVGIEQAFEDMQTFDDGDIDAEELPALGDRIAEARRNYAYAA